MTNFKDLSKKIKVFSKNKFIIASVALVVLVVAGSFYMGIGGGLPILKIFGTVFGQSNDKVAQTAIDYINNNGLAFTPASLVNVSEESGLVKIKIKIGDNEFDSYATKDGKLLIPQVIEMSTASGSGE